MSVIRSDEPLWRRLEARVEAIESKLADPVDWKARAEAAEAREQAWRAAAEAFVKTANKDIHDHECVYWSGEGCSCEDEALALLERARGLG